MWAESLRRVCPKSPSSRAKCNEAERSIEADLSISLRSSRDDDFAIEYQIVEPY